MPMNSDIRALRTSILKLTIFRDLVHARVAPAVADEITSTGEYGATADGQIFADFAEGRTTEDPQAIVAIVERLMLRATPAPPQRVVDKRTNVAGAF